MKETKHSEISPELVRRVQAGEEAAFNELYQRSAAMIYRTIFSMVRNEDTAWDIHQNTYIRAWQGLKKLDNPEAFLSWLRRIAVNETLRALSQEQPLCFSELEDEDGEAPQFEDERESSRPELELDRQETARLVREILDKLPQRQRLIVGMYYYENYSVKEIAEALQISQGTVKTQLHLGRKRIETEVRRLEGEGVKLYGASPTAFLVLLLQKQEPARAIGKKAAQAVLSRAAAGEPVVLTAKAVGTGFLHGVLGKLAVAVLAAAVLGGGVMGYRFLRDRRGVSMGDQRPTETQAVLEPAPASSEAESVPTGPEATEPAEIDQTLPTGEFEGPLSGSCGENLTWRFDPDSGLLSIEGSGAMEDYEASGDGYVSEHDRPWAQFRDLIRAIRLPEGLTHLGSDAFLFCTGLTSEVVLPEGLRSVGRRAFDDCNHMPALSLPASLETVGDWAFANCGMTSVTIPEGLAELGESAFSGCTSLDGIRLPESLRVIGSAAFNDCRALRAVTIPAGVSEIGENAFSGCTALTAIDVAAGNPVFSSSDGVLYRRSSEGAEFGTLIRCPAGKTGAYTIPEQTREIAAYAFAGCAGLRSVRFPDGLEEIGRLAFEDCAGLTEAALPLRLERLGDGAFYRCSGLRQLRLPALEEIPGAAFSGCSALTSLTIPENVRTIGYNAFDGCAALESVSFPESLNEIGLDAFQDCVRLTSVTIPTGVSYLDVGVFNGCSALTELRVAAGNESYSSLDGVLFDKAQTRLIKYPAGKADPVFTLPATVTKLDDAFGDCFFLEELRVDAGSESFSSLDGALYDKTRTELICYPCAKQGACTIPEGVSVIGYPAFENCAGLTRLSIPASVETIRELYRSFTGCTALTAIDVAADNPAFSSVDGVLYDKAQTELIHCPPKKAGVCTIPAGVSSLTAGDFQDCSLLTEIRVAADNEALSSLDGVLFDKAQTELIRFPCAKRGEYEIPASVRIIHSYAFENCPALTGVTIPDGVDSLRGFTFGGCPALKSVTIPASVTHFDPFVFGGNGVCEEVQAGFTIRGVPGSKAQREAEENGFRFEPIR